MEGVESVEQTDETHLGWVRRSVGSVVSGRPRFSSRPDLKIAWRAVDGNGRTASSSSTRSAWTRRWRRSRSPTSQGLKEQLGAKIGFDSRQVEATWALQGARREPRRRVRRLPRRGPRGRADSDREYDRGRLRDLRGRPRLSAAGGACCLGPPISVVEWGEDEYRVVKILVMEDDIVHLRLYVDKLSTAPSWSGRDEPPRSLRDPDRRLAVRTSRRGGPGGWHEDGRPANARAFNLLREAYDRSLSRSGPARPAPSTANRRHSPGTPLSSTTSLSERDPGTGDEILDRARDEDFAGAASAAMRAPMCTAIPPTLSSMRSHSPVRRPARTSRPSPGAPPR